MFYLGRQQLIIPTKERRRNMCHKKVNDSPIYDSEAKAVFILSPNLLQDLKCDMDNWIFYLSSFFIAKSANQLVLWANLVHKWCEYCGIWWHYFCYSISDYTAGFGGKFGVQKDRVDKVWEKIDSWQENFMLGGRSYMWIM